jgi:hypothetical protein
MLDTSMIDKTLNEFLAPFECHALLGKEFSYNDSDNTIAYAVAVETTSNQEFLESVYNFHKPQVKCDVFLWSLLHEIGHHNTLYYFEDWELDKYIALRSKIEKGVVPTEAYYRCDVEWDATEWAVKYANTHQNELKKQWEKIQNSLMTFYKSVGVI